MRSLRSKKSQNSRAPEKVENLWRDVGNDVQNHGNAWEENYPGNSGIPALGILPLGTEESKSWNGTDGKVGIWTQRLDFFGISIPIPNFPGPV